MEEISEGVICPVTEITISKDNNNNNNKKKGGGEGEENRQEVKCDAGAFVYEHIQNGFRSFQLYFFVCFFFGRSCSS